MASRERCAARGENEALREEAAGRGDEQNAPASRMASRERCAARCESEALRFADEKLCADVGSEALQKRDAAVRENGDAAEDVLPPTERFVQHPPRETRIQPTVHSENVARRHAETLRRCECLRAARSAELAFDDADLARARGNAGEIRAFLADARFAQTDKRALLSALREKDLADTSAETLIDALETALPARAALPEDIWREAVLCPRIADENLLPVRRALRRALGEGICPSDEAAESAAHPADGGHREGAGAARAESENAAGISATCEYAKIVEAAALPGGADKAARCMSAAETGENFASGIPISGETEHKHGEAVQSRSCAAETIPDHGQAGGAASEGFPTFTTRAAELWRRIEAQVRPVHSDFPLVPDLRAALRAGRAAPMVRDILFVAAARACGIPARLNPASGEKEVWGGAWRSLLSMKKGRLRLTNSTGAPKVYGVDFTVGILENGAFRTLNFWGETLEDFWEREIPAGVYRAVHCARQIDGSVDGELQYARVAPSDCAEIALEPLPDRTGEKLLRRRLSELRAEEILPEETGTISSAMRENEPQSESSHGESSSSAHAAQSTGEGGLRHGEARGDSSSPLRIAQPMCESDPRSEAGHGESFSPARAAQSTGTEVLRHEEARGESSLPLHTAQPMREGEPRPEAGHGESFSPARAAQSMDTEGLRYGEARGDSSSLLCTAQPMRGGEPSSPARAEGRTKDFREASLTMRTAMASGARQSLPKPGRASLLAVLDPGAEPTEHFLNEVLEIREEFKNIQMELLISRRGQRENARLAETLRAVPHARLWTDFDADALMEWRKALGAGDLRLPLAVAFDARGEALFAFTNYNVGSVRSLLRCIAAAD